MNKKLKTIGKTILGGAVIAGGIRGCLAYFDWGEGDARMVPYLERSAFEDKPAGIVDYSTLFGREFYIHDEDGNGSADIIGIIDNAYWIADGHESERFRTNEWTSIMTPEIRDAATKALHADRELGYLMAQEAYRLQEEEKKNDR